MRTWRGSRVSLYRVSSKTTQPLVLTLARCLQEKGSIQSVQTFGRKVPCCFASDYRFCRCQLCD